MSIDLVSKYSSNVDEQFKAESKLSLVTNQDYDWTGAHTVKIYTVNTAPMNDYDRSGSKAQGSRYGTIESLDATTHDLTLSKDRSFTYAIDALDEDETMQVLAGAATLARQGREVIIPEIDTYVFGKMAAGAGTKPSAKELTAENIYDEIMEGNKALDNAEVPDYNRFIIVTPSTYTLLKRNKDFLMATDITQELKIRGVVAMVDGLSVIKVPENRLPSKFGFMICHPVATVAPVKLMDFKMHVNPPGINGTLVEGRIAYDAFILENKKKGIYYQAIS